MNSMKNFVLILLLIAGLSDVQSQDYWQDLNKLNIYLKDISDGFYGQFEVKDHFIILNFKEGKYSKFKMQDMADPLIDSKYGQLHFDCKGEKYCILTDWNDEGKETGLLFTEDGSYNLEDLYELLLNFKKSYLSSDK